MHLHKDADELPSSPTNIIATTTTTITGTLVKENENQPRRPLYFAYGSNLSPTQMKLRCITNPALSSHPLAIAILPSWRWLICQAGYANVIPPREIRVGQQRLEGDAVPVSGSEDSIYGVLYEMDEADEKILDGYEGVDWDSEPSREIGTVSPDIRPREQGSGDYNKWYVSARVVKWLDEGAMRAGSEGASEVKVLIYLDEERVRLGPPRDEYIPRMNRAIAEAVELGLPLRWVEEVMRPVIPPN